LNIHHRLAVDQPDMFRRDLAAFCLDDHARHLSKLGRHKEALKSNEEALDAYRLLARGRPEFQSCLVRCLGNLSLCLSELGRHDEALKANEEATGIFFPC